MLSVCQQAECIIVDVDNCDAVTQKFISFIIAQPNANYITNDETTPYNLISKNRIYDLDCIVEQIKNSQDQEEEDDDDTQEE